MKRITHTKFQHSDAVYAARTLSYQAWADDKFGLPRTHEPARPQRRCVKEIMAKHCTGHK